MIGLEIVQLITRNWTKTSIIKNIEHFMAYNLQNLIGGYQNFIFGIIF
jgi:hypothetical protein